MNEADIYRRIVENAADYAIIGMDREGIVTRWNPGAEQILGWTSSAIMGQPASLIFTAEDQENGLPAIEMRLALEKGYANDERWHQRKDGSRFWASDEMFPLMDDAEVHIGFFKVLRDRTAQLQEKEVVALRRGSLVTRSETDALRSAILDVALDCVIAIDRDSKVLEWNQAAEQTFGYTRQEVLGRRVTELIIPSELRQRHEHGMSHYLRTGEGPVLGKRIEIEAIHADGTRLPMELAINPVWASGELQFMASLRDISTRKKAESALRESEARYRLLADHATDIIVRIDRNGIRRYVSPASRDVLGLEPEEVVGTSLERSVHPDDHAGVMSNLDDLFSGRSVQSTSIYRLCHKNGHWVWVEARRRLLRNEGGEPVEAVSVLRDITQRLQLEERLRQAQKLEAIGQLTGGIAHDFNNLLTVILGNAEVLANDVMDPGHRSLAQQTLEAAERGADLTQKLLAFGRRQSLQPVRLDVNTVVRGMTLLLQRTLGEHIELQTTFRGGIASAITDRTLLEGAILNLVINARDAMPSGGTLTIETGEKSAGPRDGALPIGQPVVFVTVRDTGSGMSPDVLQRVFEPFFTTKEVGKGSGLGLAMVHGFAQQTGCHVEIESTLGKGTSVTILLHALGMYQGQ